jgi:hypothetical protein
MQDVKKIAQQFISGVDISSVEQLGSGNVHDTFLVTCKDGYKCILQHMNRRVFPNVVHVMENLCVLSGYCSEENEGKSWKGEDRWQLPFHVLTQEKHDYYVDSDGEFWRSLSYIENTYIVEKIDSLERAREVGEILAGFHVLLDGMAISRFHDTLPGFHIAPLYLDHYDTVTATISQLLFKDNRAELCRGFIDNRRHVVNVLEGARKEGKLSQRGIHGDPKLTNILFDKDSGRAVSLIDLDTVKPGLIHYDIGDCLRSCCNRSGSEESGDLERVEFDVAICRSVLQGYLSVGAEIFAPADYEYLYSAIHLIPFELGLRFFTDYLEGNVYFKTDDVEQNLRRALVQFRLVESIEQQKHEIYAIISELSSGNAK